MSVITEQVGTSIEALMDEFNIITHNLANVSTVGFKRRCNAFSRVLEGQESSEEYSPGSIDLNSAFDFSQGGVVETGRELDFALFGRGFFVIETAALATGLSGRTKTVKLWMVMGGRCPAKLGRLRYLPMCPFRN